MLHVFTNGPNKVRYSTVAYSLLSTRLRTHKRIVSRPFPALSSSSSNSSSKAKSPVSTSDVFCSRATSLRDRRRGAVRFACLRHRRQMQQQQINRNVSANAATMMPAMASRVTSCFMSCGMFGSILSTARSIALPIAVPCIAVPTLPAAPRAADAMFETAPACPNLG
eukprot:scaffold69569_cov63-Phaeocystis_antarctica.AAC.2